MVINNFGVVIETHQNHNICEQQSNLSFDYLAFVDDKGVWVHIPKQVIDKLYALKWSQQLVEGPKTEYFNDSFKQ